MNEFSASPDASGPSARAPRGLAVLSVLVGVEGLALVGYGIAETIFSFAGDRRMPWGAVLLMALLMIGYGLWLFGAVRSLYRRRLWPRAIIVITQVFLVVLALQAVGALGWMVLLPLLWAVATVVFLFSAPVQAWLLSGLA